MGQSMRPSVRVIVIRLCTYYLVQAEAGDLFAPNREPGCASEALRLPGSTTWMRAQEDRLPRPISSGFSRHLTNST